MNVKLKIIIGISVVILLGLIIYALFYLPKNELSNIQQNTFTIKDIQGKDIKVVDFVSSAVINFDNVPVLESNDRYTIQYDTKNNVFQIHLGITDAKDLNDYRNEAEIFLIKKLNISIEQLCTLPIVETVFDNDIVVLPVYNYGAVNCSK